MNKSMLTGCLLAGSLFAQGNPAHDFVLPPYFDGFEGNSSTQYPFSSIGHRLQQTHNEARGNAQTGIRSWKVRRDGVTSLSTGVPRTVDVEFLMADGNAATATSTFANNYVNPATVVFTRKLVNLPDRAPAPTTRPMAWDITLLYDVLWNYSGTNDLLWEIRVFSNTVSGAGTEYYSDYATQNAASIAAMHFLNGTGCTTNQGVMTLNGSSRVERATGNLVLAWAGLRAPANEAQVVLLLGFNNPNLPFPGLCSRLYTDGVFSLPAGPASATGTYAPALVNLPWAPAYARLQIFAQAVALDVSQGALPVAVSNGVMSDLPPGLPPTFNIARLHHFSDANGVTGTLVNGGVIVRFDH